MIVDELIAWLANAAAEDRADGACALARLWLSGSLDDDQQQTAEALLTSLLDDPDPEVRRAIAQELADEPAAPRHVLFALAVDEAQIAMPVLARSAIFLEGELCEFVRITGREHQMAIACRTRLPERLSETLAEEGCREACLAMLANPGAVLTPRGLDRMADRFGDDTDMRRRLFRIRDLPAASRLLLIDRLGDCLRRRTAPDLPAARVEALIAENRDRAIIAWATRAEEAEISELVAAMIERQRLTTAFLLRAVAMGNVALFSTALASLADVAADRVEAAIEDRRRNALRAIYLKAGLPAPTFNVFATAIELWRDHLAVEPSRTPELVHRVTHALVAAIEAWKSPGHEAALVLIRRMSADAAREDARLRMNRIAAQSQPLALAAPASQDPQAGDAANEQVTTGEAETDPVEQFPVIVIPDAVLASFAMHLAEEILDMEAQETAPAPQTPVAGAIVEDLEPVAAPAAANDDHGHPGPQLPPASQLRPRRAA